MLSDNIQKYRKQKGWSQEELAVRLNVARQTISKWERGTSVPDADMLIQLSDLLGVSVSTLLGIEEKNWRADALAEELAALNAELAREWPSITRRKPYPDDADQYHGVKGKLKFLKR